MRVLRALKQKVKPATNLLAESGFSSVMDKLSVISVDVGARGAFTPDLLPAARCVTAIGFEPDPEEVKRLQQTAGDSPWRSLVYLPYALGARRETKTLNLYSKLGCSSLLTAKKAVGALFSRGDYYDRIGTAEITLAPFDEIATAEKLPPPDHIKVDIQGAELEMFLGAGAALDHALAVRTEVSFFPLYEGQPLFADIDSHLRDKGFVMMGFVESHDWRRTTKIKSPKRARGALPYSRGQLIHGDVLYMRAPEDLPESTAEERDRKLKLALIAACYQYIDHAAAALDSDAMRAHGRDTYGCDLLAALSAFSRAIGRYPAFYRKLKLPI